MSNKVSIIIPCHNAEETIGNILDSIERQSHRDIEVIVVDDGSDDKSVELVEQHCAKDHRIKLIKQQNRYAGTARNTGIDQASGDYLMFSDADDEMNSAMVEKMLQTIEETRADIVLCDAYYRDINTGIIYEQKGFVNRKAIPQGRCFSPQEVYDDVFQLSSPVPWNKIFRADLVKSSGIRFQGTKRNNDEFFTAMMMVTAKRIYFLDERLYIYNTNYDSSLQSYADDKVSVDFASALRAIREELIKRDLYERYERAFLRKVYSACEAVLKKQKDYKKYEYLFDFIKNSVFEEFSLCDEMKRLCIRNKALEYIENSDSAGEFLWKKFVYSDNPNGKGLSRAFSISRELSQTDINIAIYGAGFWGMKVHEWLMQTDGLILSGWYDRGYRRFREKGYLVSPPENIPQDIEVIDKLIVAVENEKIRDEIIFGLKSLGVSDETILFIRTF